MTIAQKNEEVVKPEVVGPRNFRHSPDIENFYRFVHDNSLRHEAKVLFKALLDKVKKNSQKKAREAKKNLKH
jgi:hypothetical protein